MMTVVAGALALAGCAKASEAPTVSQAWVRLAAVPGRPAAAYFTLHGGKADAVLTGASVGGVARAELHESRMAADGQGMTMDALPRVPLPAGGEVDFAPMGKHVMLFGVPASVKPGGTLPLTLRFADGHTVGADAKVVSAGEAGPTG